MNHQLRGHCQGCGNLQAATSGKLAHHGYTVEHGYFQGTCYGAREKPLQVSRDLLDRNLIGAAAEVARLMQRAADIASGAFTPIDVVVQEARPAGRYQKERKEIRQLWADMSEWDRKAWRASNARNAKYAADGLQRWIEDMTALADRVHGTPLVEVERAAPAARVQSGERKVSPSGRVLIAKYQDGARVIFGTEDGGKGWYGTQAWRRLVDAPAAQ